MAMVKVWDKEIKGKLYAVGDIHGCYNLLMSRLKEMVLILKMTCLLLLGIWWIEVPRILNALSYCLSHGLHRCAVIMRIYVLVGYITNLISVI
jgi:hypothetical protein